MGIREQMMKKEVILSLLITNVILIIFVVLLGYSGSEPFWSSLVVGIGVAAFFDIIIIIVGIPVMRKE